MVYFELPKNLVYFFSMGPVILNLYNPYQPYCLSEYPVAVMELRNILGITFNVISISLRYIFVSLVII